MTTKTSKTKSSVGVAHKTASRTMNGQKTNASKKNGRSKRWLMYGGFGLAAATLYGISRIPIVRTMVLPLVSTAVAKNWGTLRTAMQRA
jgi:hypothetical protein